MKSNLPVFLEGYDCLSKLEVWRHNLRRDAVRAEWELTAGKVDSSLFMCMLTRWSSHGRTVCTGTAVTPQEATFKALDLYEREFAARGE